MVIRWKDVQKTNYWNVGLEKSPSDDKLISIGYLQNRSQAPLANANQHCERLSVGFNLISL